MSNPRRINARERHLILVYSNWEFGMTPQQFYAKWGVSYEQIAVICSRSDSTVRRWFRNESQPKRNDLFHLGFMDFLLEHFEEIPKNILVWLYLNSSEYELR
jgi:hypothetical protein